MTPKEYADATAAGLALAGLIILFSDYLDDAARQLRVWLWRRGKRLWWRL